MSKACGVFSTLRMSQEPEEEMTPSSERGWRTQVVRFDRFNIDRLIDAPK